MTRAGLLAALRRFVVLLMGVAVVTLLFSFILGVLAKWGANRSIATGFELVGALLLVLGFFAGNRGPARLKDGWSAPFFGSRFLRLATPDEREETLNESAIFIAVGLILIVLGVAVDSRYKLF